MTIVCDCAGNILTNVTGYFGSGNEIFTMVNSCGEKVIYIEHGSVLAQIFVATIFGIIMGFIFTYFYFKFKGLERK